MVLKRPFFGETEQASSHHIHCSDLGETELQALLSGDSASGQNNSFSEIIVLKMLFIGDTGKTQIHYSSLRETEL